MRQSRGMWGHPPPPVINTDGRTYGDWPWEECRHCEECSGWKHKNTGEHAIVTDLKDAIEFYKTPQPESKLKEKE